MGQSGAKLEDRNLMNCSSLKTMTEREDMLTSENILIIKKPLDESDIEFITQRIKRLSYLSDLDEEDIHKLAFKFCKCVNSEDEWLFKQGSVANYFFIIREGKVDVVKDGFHARSLREGDIFGELALLYGIRRSSGIKVPKEYRSKNMYYALKKETFDSMRQSMTFPFGETFLPMILSLPAFKYLTKREIKMMLSVANRLTIYENQRVLTRFDVPHALFFIIEGEVRLRFPGGIEVLLGPNQFFGYYGVSEIDYSAVTTRDTRCYTIGREHLDLILKNSFNSYFLNTRLKSILMNSPELHEELSPKEIYRLSQLFSFETVRAFQPLGVHKQQISHIKVPITCCNQLSILGLHDVLNGDNLYTRDIQSDRNGFLASIDTNLFLDFLKGNFNKKDDPFIGSFESPKCKFIKVIYETEYLKCELKCEPKFGLHFETLSAHIGGEKKISDIAKVFESTSFNFIRNYYRKTITRRGDIILSIQCIKGIFLNEIISEIGLLPFPIARFYLGSLLLSLEYLHSKNIVFRNFGFKSFRVDQFGYLWLYDLTECIITENGQAQNCEDYIVGSPHWQAPEAIEKAEISYGVDFWGLGVLAYTIVLGHYPFARYQKNTQAIYQSILSEDIDYPINCRSKALKDLVSLLLNKDPKIRNALKWKDVKQMQFFHGLDWDKLKKKVIDSPYIPNLYKLIKS